MDVNNPKQQSLSRDEWSKYWKNDTITTFLDTFKGNYDGEIKAFWFDFFSKLPKNAKIIDLATGNGALALLAAEYSHHHTKNFTITAVDFAEINPKESLTLSPLENTLLRSIQFIGNTNIEATHLEEAYFDVAISQYGIEYSNLEKTATELQRILKPKAYFAAIVHTENSLIVKQAKEALEQIQLCIDQYHLKEQTLEMINYIDHHFQMNTSLKLLDRDKSIIAFRHAYNTSINKLHTALSPYKNTFISDYILSNYIDILSKPFSNTLNQKIKKIADMDNEIEAYQARMHDLLAASLSHKHVLALKQSLLEKYNIHINVQSFSYQGDIIGSSLTLVR